MKIYDELKLTLKEKNGLLDENGEIKKWVIMEKARNYDNELIGLLLKNERLKSEFFKKIDETTIFLQEKFCDFLELKSFMSDSFTSFKNKIGLTNGNKFISKDSHVVLNFPYKDCVLEGGASHDDDKGKEIFFNEILGVKSSTLRIIFGGTFDWTDIICYLVGCILAYMFENLSMQKSKAR